MWLDEVDPEFKATTLVGKRRAESAERANTEYVAGPVTTGGRRLWHPLFEHDDAQQNAPACSGWHGSDASGPSALSKARPAPTSPSITGMQPMRQRQQR